MFWQHTDFPGSRRQQTTPAVGVSLPIYQGNRAAGCAQAVTFTLPYVNTPPAQVGR